MPTLPPAAADGVRPEAGRAEMPPTTSSSGATSKARARSTRRSPRSRRRSPRSGQRRAARRARRALCAPGQSARGGERRRGGPQGRSGETGGQPHSRVSVLAALTEQQQPVRPGDDVPLIRNARPSRRSKSRAATAAAISRSTSRWRSLYLDQDRRRTRSRCCAGSWTSSRSTRRVGAPGRMPRKPPGRRTPPPKR